MQIVLQEVPSWLRKRPLDASEPTYTSAFMMASGTPLLRAWTTGGGAFFRLLRADGIECLVERTGERVWMAWPEHGPADPYEFLLELVLGFVLRLRGFVCLHAAAVEVGRAVVALAGPPGVGKSTLAAALGRRGHPVLTDDVAAVTRRRQHFVVHPGPSRLRLRRQGAELLDVEAAAPIEWTPSPDGECVDLDLSQSGFVQRHTSGALRAICFLESQMMEPGPRLEEICGADALIRLLGDTWAARLQDRAMRTQEFDDVSTLVADAKLYRLTYHPAADWVSVSAGLVEQTLLSSDEFK